MFWKRKIKTPSVGFLFIQAITLADNAYEQFVKNDDTFEKDKSNHWYFYFSVASAMTGLFELKGVQYESHYLAMLKRLGEWDLQGIEVAEEFCQFVKDRLKIDDKGIDNLKEVIGLWLHYNIKESSEIFFEESKIYMTGGNFIYDVFYKWFTKNNMPLK
jgi:hypothetical protein